MEADELKSAMVAFLQTQGQLYQPRTNASSKESRSDLQHCGRHPGRCRYNAAQWRLEIQEAIANAQKETQELPGR